MSRIDVTDRDPFANADAEPKDNVTAIGFLTRLIFRFGVYRLIAMILWFKWLQLGRLDFC